MSDAVVALARFIPEVNWTSHVRKMPLLDTSDCLPASFELLKDGRVPVRPRMRTQAYESAMALLHLLVQRLCADAPDDTHRIVASKVGPLLGFNSEDHEPESTLQVIDAALNGERFNNRTSLLSEEIERTIQKTYQDFKLALLQRSSAASRRRATNVLELLVHLKLGKLYVESHNLFLTIIADVESDGWLWGPAKLSLFGAFKWGTSPPPIEDPSSLVRFLKHRLGEQENGINVDVPIERVLLALAGAPAEVMRDGIANVDFTQPLLFEGICRSLRNDVPRLPRRATAAFLLHLDAQFFDTEKTFSDSQVKAFVDGWFSFAQEALEKEPDQSLRTAPFGTSMSLLDSPFWREHTPRNEWHILPLVAGMAEKYIPPLFYRCVKNPIWAAILWTTYPDLSDEVKSQLEELTKGMIIRPSRYLLPTYLTIVEGQIKKIQDRIHPSSSFGR
ncbi:hypothetical protein BJ322DRAFT_1214173, partial [Thelephora terrestris]